MYIGRMGDIWVKIINLTFCIANPYRRWYGNQLSFGANSKTLGGGTVCTASINALLVSLFFATGRHCYAGRATRQILPRISSLILQPCFLELVKLDTLIWEQMINKKRNNIKYFYVIYGLTYESEKFFGTECAVVNTHIHTENTK